MNAHRALFVALAAGAVLAVASARAEAVTPPGAPPAAGASDAAAEAVDNNVTDNNVADAPVEAGRKAFADVSAPWYDAQTDSLTPMSFDDGPDWKPWDFGSVFKVLAWVFLAVLLAVLLALVYIFFRNYSSTSAPTAAHARRTGVAADQVEALPFLAERRRDDLLGQARWHYQQGNYSEAIIYLFSYELVELDKFSIIRLAKGKTNRQYLREARRTALLAGTLERTMNAFESVFFGSRPLDRRGFEDCWNGLDQFEEQLRAAAP